MNNFITIESKNHKYATTYGGDIRIDDFCTDSIESRNMAYRIISDWKFDEKCRRTKE